MVSFNKKETCPDLLAKWTSVVSFNKKETCPDLLAKWTSSVPVS